MGFIVIENYHKTSFDFIVQKKIKLVNYNAEENFQYVFLNRSFDASSKQSTTCRLNSSPYLLLLFNVCAKCSLNCCDNILEHREKSGFVALKIWVAFKSEWKTLRGQLVLLYFQHALVSSCYVLRLY